MTVRETPDSVSVIIPVAPGRSSREAIRALESLPRSEAPGEILAITGTQPAQQRNIAAQRATGDILYFLDNDSCVTPGTLKRLLQALGRPGTGAAGGPNVSARPVALIDRLCEAVLSSPVGSPLVYDRYSTGKRDPRDAGEKSLILCNLMVRRELFLKHGGFDPRLYPNEENEFLNRIRASGALTVYVSAAVVTKRRNYSTWRFIHESWRYGRGRMEQVWINPHAGDVVFVAIPVVAAVVGIGAFSDPEVLWVLAPYVMLVAAEGVRLAGWRGPTIAALIVLRHAAYLLGLFCGVFSSFRRRGVRITRMRVNLRKSVVRRGRARVVKESRFGIGFFKGGNWKWSKSG